MTDASENITVLFMKIVALTQIKSYFVIKIWFPNSCFAILNVVVTKPFFIDCRNADLQT